MTIRAPLDWSRLNKVLLVRLRSIGDTILMTPCLEALKQFKPDVETTVVSEASAAPVLEGHPLIDDLLVTNKDLRSRSRLIAQVRRHGFDVAFNLHGGTTAMWLTSMSGAKHTIGFREQRGSWMLSDRAPAPNLLLGRTKIHSVEQQLALLGFAGVPAPQQPRLSLAVSSDVVATVQEKLIRVGLDVPSPASRRFAIVAPGAAFESKRWTARGFASVIDHLKNRWGLESIIIAGPGQDQIAGEVSALSESKSRILSQIDLVELKAVIAHFGRVFIGNDSGPMHIAAAFECPVVAVFGSSNPDVWHPWSRAAYRVVGGERGRPDGDIRGSIDRIEVHEVIAAVDEVVESAATRAAL